MAVAMTERETKLAAVLIDVTLAFSAAPTTPTICHPDRLHEAGPPNTIWLTKGLYAIAACDVPAQLYLVPVR
jgi:hypothetical protein